MTALIPGTEAKHLSKKSYVRLKKTQDAKYYTQQLSKSKCATTFVATAARYYYIALRNLFKLAKKLMCMYTL
jgi:hypothetical protein